VLIRFGRAGAPTYRLFEMVNDAERVRAGLARLRK
jgi:hypothetical protein